MPSTAGADRNGAEAADDPGEALGEPEKAWGPEMDRNAPGMSHIQLGAACLKDRAGAGRTGAEG